MADKNAPAGTPPHIAVAPELRDGEHTVVREPDESDEDYWARCELLGVLLDLASDFAVSAASDDR